MKYQVIKTGVILEPKIKEVEDMMASQKDVYKTFEKKSEVKQKDKIGNKGDK